MTTALVVPEREQLQQMLGNACELASVTDRDDLVAGLRALADRVADPTVRVVVVGQFKQGKSALVNALVDAMVCPVDDVLGTSVPTVVKYGKTVTAVMVSEVDGVDELQHKPIPVESLRSHVTEAASRRDGIRPVRVDVTLPSPILEQGLVFIDTPGVGGTTSAHAASTMSMMPMADAVFMLSDASQEFTEPELTFMKQAMSLCPTFTAVLSKTDLHPQWRTIGEANRLHLEAADLDIPLQSVSASLHVLASSTRDPELDEESGVPELRRQLNDDVLARIRHQTGQAVGRQILSVVEHLRLGVESELATLRNPGRGAAVVRSLSEAQSAARALGQRTAKWQQSLNDGANDLASDIDYDLRDRLRRVGREGEMLIDDCDPSEVWEEIGAWLADSVAQAVSDNFVWAHQRAEWLAVSVAELFAIEGDLQVPSMHFSESSDGVLNPVAGLEAMPSGHMSVAQKMLVGMRNSYGGVLMFGLLTSLTGMALVNPFSIAAGMLVGGYAYRQDASQRLERRRGQAKQAIRRVVDEAIFQVGKESKDRLRDTRKTLRDHFTEVADHMQRSLQEAIESAKSGAASGADDRVTRISELEERLTRLAALGGAADRLVDTGAQVEAAAGGAA